ncbi:MAG: hypothetical protein HGA75_10830, partial [Thiobacillus sp.]|nr:hypothetical protein [Thiobacillus sp.]
MVNARATSRLSFKLAFLIGLLVLVTGSLIGWIGFREFALHMEHTERRALSYSAATVANDFSFMVVKSLSQVVRTLAGLPAIRGLYGPNQAAAAEVMMALMRAKPEYRSVRLVGAEAGGRERVRFDRDAATGEVV